MSPSRRGMRLVLRRWVSLGVPGLMMTSGGCSVLAAEESQAGLSGGFEPEAHRDVGGHHLRSAHHRHPPKGETESGVVLSLPDNLRQVRLRETRGILRLLVEVVSRRLVGGLVAPGG